MKLYATVASERATKGQGGNDYIRVDLQRERGRLSHIIEYSEAGLRVTAVTDDGGVILYEERKGEKQKIKYCFQCSPNGGYSIDGVCEICQGINDRADEQEKGEKQKGEQIREWLKNGEHDKLKEEDYIPE